MTKISGQTIMHNDLKWLFVSGYSKSELEQEVDMAQALIDHDGTVFSDSTFEEGYIAALNFVLGRQASNVAEEYQHLMVELNDKKAKADHCLYLPT